MMCMSQSTNRSPSFISASCRRLYPGPPRSQAGADESGYNRRDPREGGVMEFVSRMMDGSIPYDPKDAPDRGAVPSPKVTQSEKATYLQRVPILEDCTKSDLQAISRITSVLEASAGEVLARAGEPGDRFFIIVDGTARVDVSPQEQHRVGPGSFFGEMSLLDGEPRSATVVAETAVRLLVIRRDSFHKLLDKTPGIGRSILITL